MWSRGLSDTRPKTCRFVNRQKIEVDFQLHLLNTCFISIIRVWSEPIQKLWLLSFHCWLTLAICELTKVTGPPKPEGHSWGSDSRKSVLQQPFSPFSLPLPFCKQLPCSSVLTPQRLKEENLQIIWKINLALQVEGCIAYTTTSPLMQMLNIWQGNRTVLNGNHELNSKRVNRGIVGTNPMEVECAAGIRSHS